VSSWRSALAHNMALSFTYVVWMSHGQAQVSRPLMINMRATTCDWRNSVCVSLASQHGRTYLLQRAAHWQPNRRKKKGWLIRRSARSPNESFCLGPRELRVEPWLTIVSQSTSRFVASNSAWGLVPSTILCSVRGRTTPTFTRKLDAMCA
jgi:hypothetical protein